MIEFNNLSRQIIEVDNYSVNTLAVPGFRRWTYKSEVNLALMGLRLRKYIELKVRLHLAGEV